jgi:hypothetical protein
MSTRPWEAGLCKRQWKDNHTNTLTFRVESVELSRERTDGTGRVS